MKKLFLIAVFIISATSSAIGQVPNQRSALRNDEEQAIRDLERSYAEAVRRQDVAALKEILAEDFIATSSAGEIRNRTQEIEDIKPVQPSPDFVLEGFDLDDINVRVIGSAAIVTGRSILKVNYKGQKTNGLFRYTRVYVKRKNRWQAVSQQLTRLPQPK